MSPDQVLVQNCRIRVSAINSTEVREENSKYFVSLRLNIAGVWKDFNYIHGKNELYKDAIEARCEAYADERRVLEALGWLDDANT
jgi:hypothetical protein